MERELSIILKARDEASKNIQGIGKAAGNLASMLEGSFKNATVISGAAMAGLAAEAFRAVDAFQESRAIMAQTEAVIKSTGGSAGVTADQVEYLAGRYQRLTGMSDETIQSAENMLLTFTEIGKEVFPDATKTVLDMSVALGQDTKNSAIQLGKALNDPITGVSALRKVGVTFNETQMETIKRMQESGDIMGAQKLILKELSREFGGSAEAAGKADGGFKILMETIGGFEEALGEFILSGIDPLIPKFQEVLDQINNVIAGETTLTDLTKTLKTEFGGIGEALGMTIEFFNNNRVALIALAGAFAGILAIGVIAATVAIVAFIGLSVPVLAAAAAIGAGAALIIAYWGQIVPFFQNLWNQTVAVFNNIVAFVSSALTQIGAILNVALNGHVLIVMGALELIRAAWEGGWQGFYNTLVSWITKALAFITDGIGKIKNMFSELAKSIEAIFRNIHIPSIHISMEEKDVLGKKVSIPKLDWYENGGFVPFTGAAMLHAGEFVMSRDMMAGNTPMPAGVTNNNQPITINAVINSELDIDKIGQRLLWQMRNSR